VFETLDGFTVVEDPETGYYNYARLSEDKSYLVSTGVLVGDADPQTIGVPSGIRIRRAAAKEQARAAKDAEGPVRRWEVRQAQRRAARATLRRMAGPVAAAPPPGATVGNYVGLCLLIEFPDVAATIPQSEVNDYCNQVGYAGFGNNGSVRDYFHEVSGQKLTYTNTVTAYYTAANNRSYYTDPSISYGTRARELIREALDSLVALGFDFSGLSSDSGGYVYALNVFYVGPTVNAWAKGLWPHSSGLGTPYTVGSKKFNDYQFTNMGAELTLGTFCHENGHMICDFPDLYDYGYESKGAGRFCLMANSGNGKNPIHVGAYLKNAAGWADSVTRLSPGMTATVAAGQNEFLLHERSSTEYFILENRRQVGRDASLPDDGLAIWHIDELGSNNNEQMTASQHFECALEQADGSFDLESGANSGDASDLFGSPSSTNFNQTTTPNSRWWDGTDSGLSIASISAPGATMTVVVAGGVVAAVMDDPGARLLLLG
jgi:M6 family metalloprotease-like protein